jgi:hypothetical protein
MKEIHEFLHTYTLTPSFFLSSFFFFLLYLVQGDHGGLLGMDGAGVTTVTPEDKKRVVGPSLHLFANSGQLVLIPQ